MLKKLISWFKEQFFVSLSHGKQWEAQFTPCDIEKIDKSQGFSAEAEKWGKINQPKATESIDAGHSKISQYFRQLGLELNANVERRHGEYKSFLLTNEQKQLLLEIKGMPQRLTAELNRIKIQTQQSLQQIESSLVRAENDLNRFRELNHIEREPIYPKSPGKYWGLPFFLLAFEVAFNSAVFSFAEDGLRGGIQIALILGAVNVLISAYLGKNVRIINSRNIALKAGGVLIALALALYAPLNLIVAHFRDASLALNDLDGMSLKEAITKQGNLFSDSIQSFMSSPFSLGSIESWGLFLIGVTFAAIAAHHGYKSDDPIPGYSNLDKRAKELNDELLDEREGLTAKMDESYKLLGRELEEKIKQLDSLNNRSSDYFQLTHSLLTYHQVQMKEYQSAYEALVHRYRAENVRFRTDSEPPAFFTEPPAPLEIPALDIDLGALATQEQQSQAFIRQAARDISRVQIEFSDAWRAEQDAVA